MGRLLEFLATWFRIFLEYLAGVAGSVIEIFRWPADLTGIAPEVWAAGAALFVFVLLWRALGGYFD